MQPFPWCSWQLHTQVLVTSYIGLAAAAIAVALMMLGLLLGPQLPGWWFALGHAAALVGIVAAIRHIRASTRLHIQMISALR